MPDDQHRAPDHRPQPGRVSARLLGAVALGGALGAAVRHGLAVLLPSPPGGFPLATFLVNATGCLAIGVLMAVLAARPSLPALIRPFLGVGFLGGFTTFSTYVMDVHRAESPYTALLALLATPLVALPAVAVGSAAARTVLRRGSAAP